MNGLRLSAVSILIALALLLGACAPAAAPQPSTGAQAPGGAPSGPPVKIGFIAPLSGAVAAYGAGVKHAPTLVVKETNATGGINGSPLELVTIDSPNNPNQTVTGLRRLANDDKVVALLGPYYTGEMQAAVPLLKELKLPLLPLTPAATHPGVVELNEWAFLADSSEERTVSIALDAFKKVYPNVHRMVVVGDSQTAVTAVTLRDVWPKVLPERGYAIVDTITFQFNTTDFSPIATRIRASGAEGIALSALSPAGPSLLQELERQGTHLPVVTSAHLQTVPPLAKLLGKTGDGMIQTFFYSPALADQPRVHEWLTQYAAEMRADNPSADSSDIGFACEIQTYDDASILVQAMRNAGITGSTPIAEARERTRQALMAIKDFPGVLRPKEITAQGRVTWDFYPLIAQDGAWRPIPE